MRKLTKAQAIMAALTPTARDERVNRKVNIEKKQEQRTTADKLRDAKKRFRVEQNKIETARAIAAEAERRWASAQTRWNKITLENV